MIMNRRMRTRAGAARCLDSLGVELDAGLDRSAERVQADATLGGESTEVESALGALPADFLDDDQPVRAATPGHSRTSSNGSFKKLPETKDVVESFFA